MRGHNCDTHIIYEFGNFKIFGFKKNILNVTFEELIEKETQRNEMYFLLSNTIQGY